jgi:predicted aspartyl protease
VIHGTVVGLQARMSLIILPPESPGVQIECVVDTGFEGFLTLPPSVIAALINYLASFSTIDVNQVDRLTIAAGSVQGKNYILSQAIAFTGIEITNSVP